MTQADQCDIKIVVIGGGSRYWARDLMKDLALSENLRGAITLHDINPQAALRNQAIGEKIFSAKTARTRFTVTANPDLEDALKGADFVVISIEPGSVEMRYAELEIPLKYGIHQVVGDTVGPGGLIRAMRAVPLFVDFAHAIMRQCPQAWVINYTNPMSLCTRALYAAEPEIKAFGCCHEVLGKQHHLAWLAARDFGVEGKIPRSEIKTDVNGVNHFTWVTRATWNGRDLMPLALAEAARDEIYEDKTEECDRKKAAKKYSGMFNLVCMDLTRRFGAYACAGDRHLVEFVPWYAQNEANLHRWGVVMSPYQKWLEIAQKPDEELDVYDQAEINPSGEEGVAQIEALLGFRDLDTNVNLPNDGQSAQFPLGAVVETNAAFRRGSLQPLTANPLPEAVAGMVRRVIDMQEITLKAILTRDTHLAFQALLTDSLVTIGTRDAARMFREMLDHTRPMLQDWDLHF